MHRRRRLAATSRLNRWFGQGLLMSRAEASRRWQREKRRLGTEQQRRTLRVMICFVAVGIAIISSITAVISR